MKLLRFSPNSNQEEIRLGAMAMFDPIIVDLDKEFEGYPEERRPQEMSIQGLVTAKIPWILSYGILKATEGSPTGYKLDDVRIASPVMPSSIRDFYAFEQHVKTANENRGREVPKQWYEIPVFYFTNHTAIFGPEDVIPYPVGSEKLDYELEVAAVIGKQGRDIKPEEAEDYIFGYMIYNDWSARDIQVQEMAVGLGPAKGKDFAQSFGPYLVTPDELLDRHTGRPGVYDLEMVARINGKETSRGNWKDIHWSFGEMLARASAGVTLYPGDVIGSGTVGTGCLLEITKGQGPYLQPGDVVELEIERLGVLRNIVGEKQV
jgi:2-keto-4-pentenoate hydratase/2-oxohepta-3-ene-1,7-dioic acid hydratase in catechol pathway